MDGISENGFFFEFVCCSFVVSSDIDEAIASIAENHPEYSVGQFIADFRDMIGREPTFKEKQAFQKVVSKTKKSFSYDF
jgi:hypothetical protein